MKKSLGVILALGAMFSANVYAATDDDITDVLFVGNSYTHYNNMPFAVKGFMDSREIKNTVRRSVLGGSHLEEHWNSKRGLTTREKIQSGEYDYVIIQAFSKSALETREETMDYAGKLIEEVRANGGEPILYQTWARKRLPSTQDEITSMYDELGEKYGVRIAPVGHAWELAQAEYPEVELFSTDGTHPSSLGSYLIACVLFETITGESSMGLPTTPTVETTDGERVGVLYASGEDAYFFQRMAHQAVEDYKVRTVTPIQ